MKRLLWLLALTISCTMANGQGIIVKDFRLDTGSLDAVRVQVRDLNYRPCALVKVRIPHLALEFSGDVVKTFYNRQNEYWVYMSPGANWIEIKCPAAAPLTYNFPAGMVLEGNQTYIMQLETTASYAIPTPSSSELQVTSFNFEDVAVDGVDYGDSALVKVKLEFYALSFPENVRVEQKWNEYWVIVPTDMEQLEIVSSFSSPITYRFPKRLKKNNIYTLRLVVNKMQQKTAASSATPPKKVETADYSATNVAKDKSRDYWPLYFAEFNMDFKNLGYGLAFGYCGNWFGWFGDIRIDHDDTIIYTTYTRYGFPDYLGPYEKERTWNYQFITGPVYRLNELFTAYAGLGYTFATSDRLASGFSYEVGVSMSIFVELSLSYEHVGNDGWVKFGFGVALPKW